MLRHHDRLGAGPEFDLKAGFLVHVGAAGAVVTGHDIFDVPGHGPTLVSGYPITREMADLLVRGLERRVPTRAVLPPEVLCWDGLRLAWWRPATLRPIRFRTGKPDLDALSLREVLHPATLFVTDPGRLRVYALAGDARPTAATPVFQAPYYNTYADGSVCAGAVPFPRSAEVTDIPAWERAWYESEGTHCTCRELTRYPGGHDALWPAMRTATVFPVDSLVPTGQTVLDVLNQEGLGAMGPAVQELIVGLNALVDESVATAGGA